jgi:hypothetical protein
VQPSDEATNDCASLDQESQVESSPSTKLERRRRIEQIMEDKRLQYELQEYEDI